MGSSGPRLPKVAVGVVSSDHFPAGLTLMAPGVVHISKSIRMVRYLLGFHILDLTYQRVTSYSFTKANGKVL